MWACLHVLNLQKLSWTNSMHFSEGPDPLSGSETLSRAIRSVAAGNQWSRPIELVLKWFHWSTSLIATDRIARLSQTVDRGLNWYHVQCDKSRIFRQESTLRCHRNLEYRDMVKRRISLKFKLDFGFLAAQRHLLLLLAFAQMWLCAVDKKSSY